ncbi:MAG: XdhC family protein, partial [Rhodocyclaceae bacterium]|nr:XdhC family protein [Rhodocyclaceae bacterium]
MKAELFERLLAERAAKRAVTLVTRLADGEQALVIGDEITGDLQLAPEQRDEIHRRLRSDKSGALESSDGKLFARCYVSAPRMVIVGAVHITQALAPMAAMAGFEVIVIDPRRAFA